MEFRQLRSFVEVVRQGGFTQAGKTLHATQSTVSKQVAQLEQRLGVQLLERSGPNLRLTDAGAVVLRHAEDMLRQRQDLHSELDDLSHLRRGELRLGLPLLGGEVLFAELFAEYRRRYPNIVVRLFEGGSKLMEEALLQGELELGGSLTPNDPALDYQPFCNEPLDILVPADHPLAGEPSLALAQLADSPFLLYQQSFTLNDRLLLACRQAGFTPREVGRSGQADFLAALVAAGQGVVLLPRIVARPLQRPGPAPGAPARARPALGHRLRLAPRCLPVEGGPGLAGAVAGVFAVGSGLKTRRAGNLWGRIHSLSRPQVCPSRPTWGSCAALGE